MEPHGVPDAHGLVPPEQMPDCVPQRKTDSQDFELRQGEVLVEADGAADKEPHNVDSDNGLCQRVALASVLDFEFAWHAAGVIGDVVWGYDGHVVIIHEATHGEEKTMAEC